MTDPLQEICKLIRSQNTFLVLSHYRPDGDAVGSQLAMALLLKDLGKQVHVWNDDVVPAKYQFFPHHDLIRKPPSESIDFDVVITIDTASWQRVGTASNQIRGKKHSVNIDHHVSNDKFADINWIVPEAPASGLIVYQIIRQGGFILSRDIATCLFAAISTDTGSFTFSNTTAESFRIAADLVDAGADVGEISRQVYQSYPLARVRLLQMALANMRLTDNDRIAYFWLTREMYNKSGAKREDTEGLIEHVRSIRGVVVAVLFEELPQNNKFRVSLRSKDRKVDVNAIANQFDGGGHPVASGARIEGEQRTIEHKVLTAISTALKQANV